MNEVCKCGEDYIVVKALENGVTIMGLTWGKDTVPPQRETDKERSCGPVYRAYPAIKIRGKAEASPPTGG